MRVDPSRANPDLLDLPDRAVSALLSRSVSLAPHTIMLVGARCRDVMHSALGHEGHLTSTEDLDLGLGLADLDEYDEVTASLTPTGNTGIRYLVAGGPIDLMPFGGVEDPEGAVTPTERGEVMSVWAFSEVFRGSVELRLASGSEIRLPTVEGFAALKVAAWLDRSAYGEFKDARDLAICVHWYAESVQVDSYLYEDSAGQELLIRYDVDPRRAAAHVLGVDIGRLIGRERVQELDARWPGSMSDLAAEFRLDDAQTPWPADRTERIALVRAMEAGWREALE